MDFLHKPGSITTRANSNYSHIISAVLTVILSTVVITSIFTNTKIDILSVSNIGMGSVAIALIYLIGMRLIFKTESKEIPAQLMDKELTLFRHKGVTLSKAYIGFLIAATLVVISGIWLAGIGEEIAKTTGLGRTFVGSIFLAIVTSFPEVVVSVAALKLGSIDLAFGNIFGSNMINFFIIPITDIAYRKGALLDFISQTHILTASLGIFLTCIAIIGLTRCRKKAFLRLGWDTIAMVLVYLGGTYMLFKLR